MRRMSKIINIQDKKEQKEQINLYILFKSALYVKKIQNRIKIVSLSYYHRR